MYEFDLFFGFGTKRKLTITQKQANYRGYINNDTIKVQTSFAINSQEIDSFNC